MRTINLYEIAPGVTRLGPGKRFGIWVQGCPFRCPGCITPDSQSFTGGFSMVPQDLIDLIEREEGLEGVTISGGEPFSQAETLGEISEWCQKAGLTVIVFTGHKLSALKARNDSGTDRFLANTDVLIDGLYIDSLKTDGMMRGSDNQKLHFLKRRYSAQQAYFLSYHKNSFEIVKSQSGNMLVGIPGAAIEQLWRSKI